MRPEGTEPVGRRLFSFFLLAAMLIGAVVTYEMKRRAEAAANEVARLEAEISGERDRLAALRAEWSLLTQPGRLQAIIEQHDGYFRLEPFRPEQVATLDEIPMRPIGSTDDVKELIARLGAAEFGPVE
jgi:hypothetical protein